MGVPARPGPGESEGVPAPARVGVRGSARPGPGGSEGVRPPRPGWEWGSARPGSPSVSASANVLFSALTAAALAPPNALASLCLRSPARRGPPSPKPTSPWSLLPLCLHSLARAASGRTPTPLPGTAVVRQPGVRYPAPSGPEGRDGGSGLQETRSLTLFPGWLSRSSAFLASV